MIRDLRLTEFARQMDLDCTVRLGRTLARSTYAFVGLVEEDHVVVLAGCDGVHELARDTTISAWTLDADEVFWLADAATDRRFCGAPHVATAPYLRFYASAPIVVRGRKVGVLAVASDEVRPYDPETAVALKDLAQVVATEFELKVAQTQLAAEESRIRAEKTLLDVLVDDAPLALAMVDREMRYIRTSRRWRYECGLTDSDLIGRCHYDVTPNISDAWKEAHQRCLQGATLRSDGEPYVDADGAEHWIRWEVTPWYEGSGAVGGLVIMTEDLSDQMRARAQIEQSETRLRLAAEIADLMVWEYSFASRSFQYAEGATPSVFSGDLSYERLVDEWLSRIHQDDRDRVAALWTQQMQAGSVFNAEYRQYDRHGHVVWRQNIADMIRDIEGRPERIVGVVRDVTERKLGELAVENARAEAEAANRAKSDFLANMSHEIRTPLNGVLGVASALARTDLNDDQRQMVQIIEHSGQVLEVLLSDLLDLARIESGKLELRPEAFDLEGALREAASLFEAGALGKGLALNVDIDPALSGAFHGDPVRLRQIVSNLLSNAVKFTGQGAVSLSARVTGEAGGSAVMRIAVADTGIGFDEATRQRLFERFEQADGSITRRFGGTGLGLAICRSLAEMMGGRLWAESTPGAGSTFILEVELARADPLATRSPRPALGRTAEPESAERPLRVLLAEDHPTNRRVVELMLDGAGVDLTMVENGALAVEMFGLAEFDLILMDMQMPVMDGLNATRSIRATERAEQRARTPIYALTANAMPEHVDQTRQAGADGHLTKPLSAEALLTVLQAVAAGEVAAVGETAAA